MLSHCSRSFTLKGSFVTLTLILVFVLAYTGLAMPGQAAESDTTFSTYYGGSSNECIFDRCAIAVDNAGNIYLAGTTKSSDFPLVNPLFTDNDDGSGEDIFVVKIDPNGEVVFSTYIPDGAARGIAVDDAGDIYVVGESGSESYPVTADALQDSPAGLTDFVFFKLKGDGSELLYSTYIGGGNFDIGYDIALDSQGNIILTGWSDSSDFPTVNAAQATNGGLQDIVVLKMKADLSGLVFSTYYGGERRDNSWAVAVDDVDNVYLGGRSASNDFPTTPGVVQNERFSGAGNDGVVVKLQPQGNVAYSTFYNLDSSNEVTDIAVDRDGNAHMIMRRSAVKLNSSASAVLYDTEVPVDVGIEGEGGIALDDAGNAYVTGFSPSSVRDLVIAGVQPGGQLAFTRTFGGSDEDRGEGIALYERSSGQVDAYVIGYATSDDFPVVNPIQSQLNGPDDLIVLNLTNLQELLPKQNFLPFVIGN